MMPISLIVPPYAAIEHPSIAIGLLSSALRRSGLHVRSLYANLWFAAEIGLNNYYVISQLSNTDLLAEWSFSGEAFPDFQPDHEKFFDLVVRRFTHFRDLKHLFTADRLWKLRQQVRSFIAQTAERILQDAPLIVGCSSMFQQHCASLALLRKIRELAPDIVTMLGGANCEGSMGMVTHQCFEWVDYVVSGEADVLLPQLCRKIAQYGRHVPVHEVPPGVLAPCHRHRNDVTLSRQIVTDLDSLPMPDYDDYFATITQSKLGKLLKTGLLVETSRGCWWGQKQPCAFCGLNGCGARYRSKSPDRILEELDALSQRYNTRKVEVVDNILNMAFFRTVFPKLPQGEFSYKLIYETSANLGKRHVKALSDAGVQFIQAGVESLHDGLLKKLGKGNTLRMNLSLLKWAQQFGIYVIWNFLIKIPGERMEEYDDIAEWLPLIIHLQPPSGVSPIRYDRFSRYYTHQAEFNLELRPFWSYDYVYPLPPERLADLAYYFEDHANNGATPCWNDGLERVHGLVKAWRDAFYQHSGRLGYREALPARPMLSLRDEDERAVITDTRPCAVREHTVLTGMRRRVYQACDAASTPTLIVSALRQSGWPDVASEEVASILDELRSDKLMMSVGEHFFSLAIQQPQRPLPLFIDYPGGLYLLGRPTARLPIEPQNVTVSDAFRLRRKSSSAPRPSAGQAGQSSPGGIQ